jgi:hypothetical protein
LVFSIWDSIWTVSMNEWSKWMNWC